MAGVVDQALAKIDGADLGVAPNFFGRSFSNQSAAIKHKDSIGVLEHDVHIVLSKENADRFFPRDACGQPHQLDALARRHARGRLIHSKSFRSIASARARSSGLWSPYGESPHV